MSKKQPIIWSADPHTLAKIEILKNYLKAWIPITGSRFDRVVYIDGFAGPGYYRNSPEGSPLAAIKLFRDCILREPDRLIVSKVWAIFIESDRRRFEVLSEELAKIDLPRRIIPLPLEGEFSNQMDRLFSEPEFSDHFRGEFPLLIFADPFGTGVPFRFFEKCLSSNGSELILNFDADGYARIYSGRNNGWEDQLTEVFGTSDWAHVFENPSDSLATRSLRALHFYKSRLLSIPGVEYVWSFEMRGSKDRINYYLIFATRNRLGMEKMKEAMHSIDSSGNFSFSDAYHNQHILFKDDDVSFYADQLHRAFLGKVIDYSTADNFALTQTPFSNPKAILKYLSTSGLIKTNYRPGHKARAHSFPPDQVESIQVIDGGPRLEQPSLF